MYALPISVFFVFYFVLCYFLRYTVVSWVKSNLKSYTYMADYGWEQRTLENGSSS